MTIPTPTRTEALRDCDNGFWMWHRLLPDENNDWVMSGGAATHDADFPYSHFDPEARASCIYILQAHILILGPQTFNGGQVMITVETAGQDNRWWPTLSAIDGEVQFLKSYPGNGLKVSNTEQLCISIQHQQYTGLWSWIFGSNEYRAAEIELYFKLGPAA